MAVNYLGICVPDVMKIIKPKIAMAINCSILSLGKVGLNYHCNIPWHFITLLSNVDEKVCVLPAADF